MLASEPDGKLITRTRNGKTFVYLKKVKTNPNSPKQKQTQHKFTQATAFAKSVISNPVLKAQYEQKAKRPTKKAPAPWPFLST